MPTRAQVVECARSWLSTKWQHQASLKGVACDCAGLVAGVAREVFAMQTELPTYGHTPFRRTMEAVCRKYLTQIPAQDAAPGDIVLIAWDRDAHHMAIVSDLNGALGIIHSYAQARKVVENRIDEKWRERIVAAFRFPGIE
jgi:NlpC/P60 family putative phage cell wall peptidase